MTPLRGLRGYCAINSSAHCRETGKRISAPIARNAIFPIGRRAMKTDSLAAQSKGEISIHCAAIARNPATTPKATP